MVGIRSLPALKRAAQFFELEFAVLEFISKLGLQARIAELGRGSSVGDVM